MSTLSNDDALLEIEKLRSHLLTTVNTTIDTLKMRLECEGVDTVHKSPIEMVFSLRAVPATLKGTKPTAVLFGDERVAVKTWRAAYTEVLRRCAAEDETRAAFMSLRNKIYGRKRAILTDKPDNMNVPVKLVDGLYAEAYFDTDWLLRILTTQLLGAIRYDTTGISIAVRYGKNHL